MKSRYISCFQQSPFPFCGFQVNEGKLLIMLDRLVKLAFRLMRHMFIVGHQLSMFTVGHQLGVCAFV